MSFVSLLRIRLCLLTLVSATLLSPASAYALDGPICHDNSLLHTGNACATIEAIKPPSACASAEPGSRTQILCDELTATMVILLRDGVPQVCHGQGIWNCVALIQRENNKFAEQCLASVATADERYRFKKHFGSCSMWAGLRDRFACAFAKADQDTSLSHFKSDHEASKNLLEQLDFWELFMDSCRLNHGADTAAVCQTAFYDAQQLQGRTRALAPGEPVARAPMRAAEEQVAQFLIQRPDSPLTLPRLSTVLSDIALIERTERYYDGSFVTELTASLGHAPLQGELDLAIELNWIQALETEIFGETISKPELSSLSGSAARTYPLSAPAISPDFLANLDASGPRSAVRWIYRPLGRWGTGLCDKLLNAAEPAPKMEEPAPQQTPDSKPTHVSPGLPTIHVELDPAFVAANTPLPKGPQPKPAPAQSPTQKGMDLGEKRATQKALNRADAPSALHKINQIASNPDVIKRNEAFYDGEFKKNLTELLKREPTPEELERAIATNWSQALEQAIAIEDTGAQPDSAEPAIADGSEPGAAPVTSESQTVKVIDKTEHKDAKPTEATASNTEAKVEVVTTEPTKKNTVPLSPEAIKAIQQSYRDDLTEEVNADREKEIKEEDESDIKPRNTGKGGPNGHHGNRLPLYTPPTRLESEYGHVLYRQVVAAIDATEGKMNANQKKLWKAQKEKLLSQVMDTDKRRGHFDRFLRTRLQRALDRFGVAAPDEYREFLSKGFDEINMATYHDTYRPLERVQGDAKTILTTQKKTGAAPAWSSSKYFLESEGVADAKHVSQESYRKDLRSWMRTEKNLKIVAQQVPTEGYDANGYYEQQVDAVMQALHGEMLSNFNSANARVSDAIEGKGVNGEGQAKVIIGALQATSLTQGGRWQLGVQEYNDQMQAVLYDPKTREVWNLMTGARTIGLSAPISRPEALLSYDIAKGKATPAELMIADMTPVELGKALDDDRGKKAPDTKTNSTLKLPSRPTSFGKGDAPPKTAHVAPPINPALLAGMDLGDLASLASLDFSKIDLSKLDLDKLDLSKLDLSKLDLSKLDLSKFDMSKLDLSKLDLSKIDLSKIDLSGWDGTIDFGSCCDFSSSSSSNSHKFEKKGESMDYEPQPGWARINPKIELEVGWRNYGIYGGSGIGQPDRDDPEVTLNFSEPKELEAFTRAASAGQGKLDEWIKKRVAPGSDLVADGSAQAKVLNDPLGLMSRNESLVWADAGIGVIGRCAEYCMLFPDSQLSCCKSKRVQELVNDPIEPPNPDYSGDSIIKKGPSELTPDFEQELADFTEIRDGIRKELEIARRDITALSKDPSTFFKLVEISGTTSLESPVFYKLNRELSLIETLSKSEPEKKMAKGLKKQLFDYALDPDKISTDPSGLNQSEIPAVHKPGSEPQVPTKDPGQDGRQTPGKSAKKPSKQQTAQSPQDDGVGLLPSLMPKERQMYSPADPATPAIQQPARDVQQTPDVPERKAQEVPHVEENKTGNRSGRKGPLYVEPLKLLANEIELLGQVGDLSLDDELLLTKKIEETYQAAKEQNEKIARYLLRDWIGALERRVFKPTDKDKPVPSPGFSALELEVFVIASYDFYRYHFESPEDLARLIAAYKVAVDSGTQLKSCARWPVPPKGRASEWGALASCDDALRALEKLQVEHPVR